MADFSSAWLLRKKQFQSLSGVTPDQFRKMVILLRPHWKRWVVGPKNRDGRPYGVGGLIEGLARRVRGGIEADQSHGGRSAGSNSGLHRTARLQADPQTALLVFRQDERAYNHALSRFRVRVEHAIAHLKRFRILADRFRYPRKTHAAKFSIIANLIAGF